MIDSIFWALTGKVPNGIVKDGTEKAKIKLDLGEYVITKTISKSGAATLTIKSGDGSSVVTSPQKFLDGLIGSLSFDPLAFMAMPPRDQRSMLVELSGLDTESLDSDKKDALIKANEKKGAHQYALKALEKWKAETGIAPANALPDRRPLQKELAQAEAHKETISKMMVRLEIASRKTAIAEQEVDSLLKRVSLAKNDLELAIKEQNAISDQIPKEGDEIEETENAIDRIKLRLKEMETTHDGVILNQECTDAYKDFEAASEVVKALDVQRKTLIASAKMPIPGLEVATDGVNFEGRPLSALSGAESLRVGLSMAMALNPKIKVIRMKDGALLDSENLKIIKEMATGKDYQIWIERVTDDKEIKVTIEEEV